MVPMKTLLPDLKNLVTELDEDLLARAQQDDKIDAGLREAFQQVEKAGRTAQAFEVWREDYLDQVAVAWVLACVFVRFMEDNHLIDECWLAGEKERRKLAEDTHELYFRKHPHDEDREYFQHVFQEVGKIPAAKDLFDKGKTPLWAVAPSGDASRNLLKFWREIDAEGGHLERSFEVEEGDTRFLGDLYQELSEKAKKKYALLQTPVFVEEFILDRTFNPAIDEFGLEKVRLIDPTCGSGHFLLGAFARLFRLWMKRESNEIVAAQKALDGVWGVDINPFAVAIARFRLIVAAVQACGIKRLKQAPGWTIHLAAGDSLLFGSKPGWEGERTLVSQQGNLFEVAPIYAVEDRQAVNHILGQGYHAVVGNPPYITVKDKAQNEKCRELYSTCHRKYSLAVPFAQRFWELAIRQGEANGGSGYIGQITANSFMKREFGKKLIGEFFPKIDLTHVIDSSGAYIPGHSTPTVILFGRARKPVSATVRAVLGIKGEPAALEDASQGLVWQSIVKQIDIAATQDSYTSTADVPRTTFNTHPWSIGGGGISDLIEIIEENCEQALRNVVAVVGVFGITAADDVYMAASLDFRRKNVEQLVIRRLLTGDDIRDWSAASEVCCLFPYDTQGRLFNLDQLPNAHLWVWSTRTILGNRATFNKGTYFSEGFPWWKWHQIAIDRIRSPFTLTFPCVATHNHFAFDRGGSVFNRHAPIIKLPADATEDDHLALLGLLNSSTACFWMKQVFYPKATAVGDISIDKGRPEANRYEFASTGLLSFPLPNREQIAKSSIIPIAAAIDDLARRSAAILPAELLRNWKFDGEQRSLSDAFDQAAALHQQMKHRMIALQEELDWEVYRAYGLSEDGASQAILSDQNCEIVSEKRPFMWVRDTMPGDLSGTCGDIYERRRRLIGTNSNLRLIETLVFKRPWWGRQGVYGQASRTYKEWVADACRDWLFDRLESPRYWPSVELQTTARLADRVSGDAEFMQVAALYRGRPDFDLAALVAELVEGESVPFLPILRYKPSGLRKREVWERTWDLQRQEDAGKDVGEIPVPPKYATADFQKTDYWRLRGKLDVPKERWLSYPHCQSVSDPTLVIGWAGWNHLEQATALVTYYDARKREGWDAKRLTPLLAGLQQLLPWIHQWYPEIDKEFGETAGKSYQTMLEHDAHELGLTLEDVRNWQPPEKQRKTRTARKQKEER